METPYKPEAPGLEYFCDFHVRVGPPQIVGETPRGLRRVMPIIGGWLEGPEIKGTILSGGSDWQLVHQDGVVELKARHQFITDDGVTISKTNTGFRVTPPHVAAKLEKGEQVAASEYYFRATPAFEAPAGKYDWMNHTIFVCTGAKEADGVLIRIWKVL